MAQFELGNVEETHERYPAFNICSRTERECLEPNDSVKLIFLEGGRTGKCMWVLLTRRQQGQYFGLLSTITACPSDELILGDLVAFGPEHVLDWARPKSPATSLLRRFTLNGPPWLRRSEPANDGGHLVA